jgi:hypothetical protein
VTCWLSARICSSLLAMSILVGSVWGQGGDQANVTPPVPSSQAVMLTDLKGAKIQVKFVTEILAERQGRRGTGIQEVDWQIYLEPDGRINFGFRASTRTPRGTRAAPLRVAIQKLDDPWSMDNGEAIFQFKDGDLTFVRSYKSGAVRNIISLKRDGPNLTCSASHAFAREHGKSGMVLNSPIDGVPVTIFNWKLVSSTCDVTGKKLDTVDPSKP